MTEKSKPEKKFVQGNCSAAVFANNVTKDGETISVRSVSLQKSYRDKDGQWQHAASFGSNDLPKIILACQKAYDYLTTKEA